jgi:hypothetical protein
MVSPNPLFCSLLKIRICCVVDLEAGSTYPNRRGSTPSLVPSTRQHLISLEVSATVTAFVKEEEWRTPQPCGGLPDGAASVLLDLEFIEIQKE